MDSSRGGILSFPPSGSALIPPTSHCGSESQLRSRSGGLYSNNYGADSAPEGLGQLQSKGGSPAKYPEQASGHHNTTQIPFTNLALVTVGSVGM